MPHLWNLNTVVGQEMFRARALPGSIGPLSGHGWHKGCGDPDGQTQVCFSNLSRDYVIYNAAPSISLTSPMLYIGACLQLPREGGGAAMSNPGLLMAREAGARRVGATWASVPKAAEIKHH